MGRGPEGPLLLINPSSVPQLKEVHILDKIVRLIDTIAEWTGKILGWLILPLMGGLLFEVFSRYFLGAPTVWAYDVTYMLYGTIFMIGASYTLYKKAHIRTDMFYAKWSLRCQNILDAIMYLLFFFPGIILFLVAGWDYAARSWMMGERSDASPWRPPIYPFKTVIAITGFLLLLQGISEFFKSLYAIIKGRPYES